MGKVIFINDVRLSFPDLFEATEIDGDGNFKYRSSFHVIPGSQADKDIRAAIEEVAKAEFKEKADGILAKIAGSKTEICYLDGVKKDAPGVWILTANRKKADGRPSVVDRDKSPLQPGDGRPYSGCYVNAKVELWAQSGKNTGVRCALIAVQFLKDGDAFGNARPADPDGFEDLSVNEPADSLA